jgi:hypothetical protein
MQAHTQLRQRAGTLHRIDRGGAGHHQAGGVQAAGAVGALDRFVDRLRQAEVIGGEGDARRGQATR